MPGTAPQVLCRAFYEVLTMSGHTPDAILAKVTLGMSRERVVAALGEPDAAGGTSRKYRTPSIYKYGQIELWLGPTSIDTLIAIWNEDTETLLAGRMP